MIETIHAYDVVRGASERDALAIVRALDAFLRTPGGRVRLHGPDRVVVWRDGARLYLSPGASSLAGYLDPNPARPASTDLLGPEMTPSRASVRPAATRSGRIAAAELPASCVLVLGDP